MKARRVAVIAGPLVALVVYACIESCGAEVEPGQSSPAEDGGDAPPAEVAPPVDALGEPTATEVSTDSAVAEANAESAIDSGEYCPSPALPRRDDGCPCSPGADVRDYCNPLTLGKVCDYRYACPNTYGQRYVCEKLVSQHGDASSVVYHWATKGIIPCDPDAGDFPPIPEAGAD